MFAVFLSYQFTVKQHHMKAENFYKVTLKDGNNFYPFKGHNIKIFYTYDGKLMDRPRLPNFVKVENLTSPNHTEEPTAHFLNSGFVKAKDGDVLTIETDESRFVVFLHKLRAYTLFSGDTQMEWPTQEQMEQRVVEVVEAVNREFVEDILEEFERKLGIESFNNFEQIVDFIMEDVKTAGMGDFSSENIRIAFRRFVEREM